MLPLGLDELRVPADLRVCQTTPSGGPQASILHLPALLHGWPAPDHFVAIVQQFLLLEDPAPTIAGCCIVGSRFHFTQGPLPLKAQALAEVLQVRAGSGLACPAGPLLALAALALVHHLHSCSWRGRPQSPSVESRQLQKSISRSHNPNCYQHTTCTLSRMMTYALAMNRICTGGIGMGPFDLLCMCFSLVSREVASEEDRGAGACCSAQSWAVIQPQYESCCSESCCS